ncbi:unnamed protein product [Phaedon cochleariae]|uniref:Carboxylic ester hydrolase n=1 Tax=Phaedon cochleariae TaxID=80249 RepID=A0A9P0DSG5_PHACE|nr:unnamed protein product [Phaedon cochleariae]
MSHAYLLSHPNIEHYLLCTIKLQSRSSLGSDDYNYISCKVIFHVLRSHKETKCLCENILLIAVNMTEREIVLTALSALIFGYWLSTRLESSSQNTVNNLVVQLPEGKIQGHISVTKGGREFFAFQEVPYAAPPVGELRYKEAVDPKPWDGILDTTKNTKLCLQKMPIFDDQTPDPRENEDCLYLNVFTPQLPDGGEVTALPVAVYIYGGMFQSGDPSEYDFSLFLEEDIVVVTMNYRAGALGFLTTGDGVIPGNLGLKDQNLSLKWVQKNIHLFGGDPSKVTLVGHSSGAISVGCHVISEKSKGLFRGAIMQSSSPLNHIGLQKDPRYRAYALGRAMSPDFTSKNTSEDLLRLLMSLPGDKLCRTDLEIPPNLNGVMLGVYPLLWGPVIEDPSDPNAFLSGPMHDDVVKGKMNKVPLLTGITYEEFTGIEIKKEFQVAVDNNITSLASHDANIKEENRLDYANDLKSFYTSVPFAKNLTALYKVIGDGLYTIGIIEHAYHHSKYADTYFYKFSYKGPINGLDKVINKEKGLNKTAHVDELPLLYSYRLDLDVTPSVTDNLLQKRIRKLWTNFVKYQNPTPNKDPLFENVIWPKVKPEEIEFFEIDEHVTLGKNPRFFHQWKARFDRYLERPLITYH